MIIKVRDKGFTKTQDLQGNRGVLNQDILPFQNTSIPPFYTRKILKTEKTLGTITSLKAHRIEVSGWIIKTNSILETTTITSPDTYIGIGTSTDRNWFYSLGTTFTNALQQGVYIFEFSDGNYEFETDPICLTGEIPEVLNPTFDSTVVTWDSTTFTVGS